MDATFTPYSVCMSVYKNDNAAHFITALRSMSQQTIPPDEIVLVVDGPIGESLENTIVQFSKEYAALKVIRFAENRGHAAARQAGIDNANNELMIDVVGGQIEELIGESHNIVGISIVPKESEEIS